MSIFTKENKGDSSRCTSISVKVSPSFPKEVLRSASLSYTKDAEMSCASAQEMNAHLLNRRSRSRVYETRSQESGLQKNFVNVKLDSKGRISIPSFLRKNFNLQEGADVRLIFDLKKNFLVLEFLDGEMIV